MGCFSKAKEEKRTLMEGRGRGDIILGYSTVTLWVTLLPAQERPAALGDRLAASGSLCTPTAPSGTGPRAS